MRPRPHAIPDGLVEERLARFPGEWAIFDQYAQFPKPDVSFGRHRAAVILDVARRALMRREQLETPPDPKLITIKSWQFGFTNALKWALPQVVRDAIAIQLALFRDGYLDAVEWRACLDAGASAERWLAVARELEAKGALVRANAAIAAARWLDPALGAVTAGRRDDLPEPLRGQPERKYRQLPFGERHWTAWAWKNSGRLRLPSLLAYECDENFSLRTRIYRSLGQKSHPAVFPALLEATRDPHFFARAQAVRSLGWTAHPGACSRLAELFETDESAEVRRSAALALERLIGFWSYFGEWNEIFASGARVEKVARELAERGMPAIAWEIGSIYASHEKFGSERARDAWLDSLKPLALQPKNHLDDAYRYTHHFREAQRFEADIDGGDPDHESDDMRALYLISRYGRRDLAPRAAALANAPDPVGWNARRALRALAASPGFGAHEAGGR